MFTLNKSTNKDFTILNLTDPQLKDIEWDENHPHYPLFMNTLKELINRVKPDFITVSGDIAWSGQFLAYEKFAKTLDSFKIPWSPVWGNHDNDGGLENLDKVIEGYLKSEYILYENGDSELGRGNYVVMIKENNRPIVALLMMDTHNKLPYIRPDGSENMEWGKLYPTQIEWYKERVKELKSLGCNETILVTHIPIYAYRDAFKDAFRDGVDPKSITPEQSYLADFWNEGYKDSFGVKYEDVCCYPEDDNFFDVIKELDSTKNCIAGHDHVSNFSINYKGVRLSYGMKIGPGCYWDKRLNGGTVIKISENGVSSVYHEYVKVE